MLDEAEKDYVIVVWVSSQHQKERAASFITVLFLSKQSRELSQQILYYMI